MLVIWNRVPAPAPGGELMGYSRVGVRQQARLKTLITCFTALWEQSRFSLPVEPPDVVSLGVTLAT